MRLIGNEIATMRTRRGWKQYLKSSIRHKNNRISQHIAKYGPDSKSARNQLIEVGYLLEYFKRFRKPDQHRSSKSILAIRMPSKFCFIEHPEESLLGIWAAVDRCTNIRNKKLKIDHSGVKQYSLTSEAILGVGVGAVEQWRRIRKKRLHISGILPKDSDHRQLLSEIGIVRDLNAETSTPLPYPTEQQHLFEFKSTKKSSASPHSEDDKTIASEKLADHVNACVNDHNLELTTDAITALMKSTSEVLDNAERHSCIGGAGGHLWFARGYLNNLSRLKNFEMSIFNFGATIAETFLNLPSESYSKKLVLEYSTKHLAQFTEEQLITIAALQQRYSCKNNSSKENNGQGTVVLIQFFEQLCEQFSKSFGVVDSNPKMSIVSGETHIVFDGTYRLSQLLSQTDNEQLIIAFNTQHSLKSPPDSKYVRKLDKAFFPGVAISIRFPLREEEDE